jgi:dimethylamine--corrinoid protein Co-methyltransferase
MGGIRAAGDLVARMEITRGMRLSEAKQYVAGKLGVAPADLSDPALMLDLRKELGLGSIVESGEVIGIDDAIALEAKFNVAELLELPIACVERFRGMVNRRGGVKL